MNDNLSLTIATKRKTKIIQMINKNFKFMFATNYLLCYNMHTTTTTAIATITVC